MYLERAAYRTDFDSIGGNEHSFYVLPPISSHYAGYRVLSWQRKAYSIISRVVPLAAEINTNYWFILLNNTAGTSYAAIYNMFEYFI